MAATSPSAWRTWELPAKLRLYARLRHELWLDQSRHNQGQHEPAAIRDGTKGIWYARGGRGSGKTRVGAESFAHWVLSNPPGDWGIVAPTFADARDKCVEGVSGVKGVFGPLVAKWNRSIGEMHLHTGARIMIDGGDDGALRVQGENLMGAWIDEVGLIRDWETTWEESVSFAVRLDPGLIMATGTPKGKVGLVKVLLEDEDCVETYLSLADNERNLSAKQLRRLRRRYEGTRRGRQELHGEVLDDVEGALWTWAMIEANRRKREERAKVLRTHGRRAVVAVDPATTSGEDSDETGIVACARVPHTADILRDLPEDARRFDHGFVLEDKSGRYSPMGWAETAVALYYELGADRIVAERNQGGDMVESTIRTVDPNVPVTLVWASKGKQPRAEPISALYEQNRVHHMGTFPELESEQTSWVPGEDSPNHMDAAVWGFTDLFDQSAPDTVIAADTGDPGPVDELAGKQW
jgi:phage terminase large subunit-like protein